MKQIERERQIEIGNRYNREKKDRIRDGWKLEVKHREGETKTDREKERERERERKKEREKQILSLDHLLHNPIHPCSRLSQWTLYDVTERPSPGQLSLPGAPKRSCQTGQA